MGIQITIQAIYKIFNTPCVLLYTSKHLTATNVGKKKHNSHTPMQHPVNKLLYSRRVKKLLVDPESPCTPAFSINRKPGHSSRRQWLSCTYKKLKLINDDYISYTKWYWSLAWDCDRGINGDFIICPLMTYTRCHKLYAAVGGHWFWYPNIMNGITKSYYGWCDTTLYTILRCYRHAFNTASIWSIWCIGEMTIIIEVDNYERETEISYKT